MKPFCDCIWQLIIMRLFVFEGVVVFLVDFRYAGGMLIGAFDCTVKVCDEVRYE